MRIQQKSIRFCFSVRYEYRRKIVHREKMTLRRYVFATIRRTLLAAGILMLLVFALSNQDAGNSVQQGLLLEVSDDLLFDTGQGFLLFLAEGFLCTRARSFGIWTTPEN